MDTELARTFLAVVAAGSFVKATTAVRSAVDRYGKAQQGGVDIQPACRLNGARVASCTKIGASFQPGYVTAMPSTRANEVIACGCVRVALMISSTRIPRASSASAINER
jgi:hypothetical protein